MDAERYQQLQRAFLSLREQSPAAQQAELAELQSKDADLAARVADLLAADEQANPLDEPLVMRPPKTDAGSAGRDETNRDDGNRADETFIPDAADALPGEIGPWKILQKIGEGGHGVVYMAEQTSPIRRRVALKQIKAGMDSKMILARFEAERQALAMMSHPSIANVMDAGSAATGQPYFVMELVHGVPIDQFCQENGLDLIQRLQLLAQACDAIHHAHRKGIIHRDIKPANVLVTVDSGEPLVKIIDFGIAKALHMPLTDRTLFTEYGQIVGTLEYMSPEQALMSQTGIDVRSDVYSLGVLLYLLVTGETPLSKQQLLQEGIWKLRETIKDIEPPTPSLRLTSGSRPGRWKDHAPPTWHSAVKGDLDWITMKALAKEPDQRYDSAADLAGDVRRFLSGQPVIARPPSLWYSLTKTIRRHRLAAGISLALLSSLCIRVVALWLGYQRSQENLDTARQLSGILEEKATALNVALREARVEKRRADAGAEELAVIADQRTIETAWAAGIVGDRQRCREVLETIPQARRHTLWKLTHRMADAARLPQLRSRQDGSVRRAEVSGDGSQLGVLSSSGQLDLYDSVRRKKRLTVPLNQATAFALGDDGSLIVGRSPDLLTRVSATGTESETTLSLRTGGIRSILPLRSQNWAVSTGANWLHLVRSDLQESIDRVRLPQRIQGLREIDGHVWVMALDGTLHRITPAGDGWDQASLQSWPNDAGQVIALRAIGQEIFACTTSGSILTRPRSADGAKGFEELARLPEAVRSARFTADQTLVAALTDGTVGEFAPASRTFLPLQQFSEVIRDVLPTSGGDYAIVQADGDVFCWNLTQRQTAQRTAARLQDTRDGLPLSGRQLSLTGHADGRLQTSSLQSASPLQQQSVHRAEVFELTVHGDRIASVGADQQLVISQLPDLTVQHRHPIAWGVRGAAFSPNGRWLAAAADPSRPEQLREGTVDLWNMQTQRAEHRLAGHSNWVIRQLFDRAGRQLITLSVDDTARIWSVPEGDCRQTVDFSNLSSGTCLCLVETAEVQRLLIGHADGTVSVWDVSSGQLQVAAAVARDSIVDFVQVNDVLLVAAAGSAQLQQLQLQEDRLTIAAQLPLSLAGIQVVRRSPTGDSLLITSSAGQVQILPLTD